MNEQEARRDSKAHERETGHKTVMLATMAEDGSVWGCTSSDCDAGSEVEEAIS